MLSIYGVNPVALGHNVQSGPSWQSRTGDTATHLWKPGQGKPSTQPLAVRAKYVDFPPVAWTFCAGARRASTFDGGERCSHRLPGISVGQGAPTVLKCSLPTSGLSVGRGAPLQDALFLPQTLPLPADFVSTNQITFVFASLCFLWGRDTP